MFLRTLKYKRRCSQLQKLARTHGLKNRGILQCRCVNRNTCLLATGLLLPAKTELSVTQKPVNCLTGLLRNRTHAVASESRNVSYSRQLMYPTASLNRIKRIFVSHNFKQGRIRLNIERKSEKYTTEQW